MNNKQLLKKQIHQTEIQIKRLLVGSNKNDVCENLYNSLILKKAVLKKQLADLEKNPLVEHIKKMIPRKEKLICDYFQ